MRAIVPSEFVEVASGSLVRKGWESVPGFVSLPLSST